MANNAAIFPIARMQTHVMQVKLHVSSLFLYYAQKIAYKKTQWALLRTPFLPSSLFFQRISKLAIGDSHNNETA